MEAISDTKLGEEKFEVFKSSITKRPMVQYDFRKSDGELFSCIETSLDKCREQRDKWLAEKKWGDSYDLN